MRFFRLFCQQTLVTCVLCAFVKAACADSFGALDVIVIGALVGLGWPETWAQKETQ